MPDPASWSGFVDVAHSRVWSRFASPCDPGATRRRSAEFIREALRRGHRGRDRVVRVEEVVWVVAPLHFS